MNSFKSTLRAGYIRKIPSGTFKLSLIRRAVRAATRFPPAESPTRYTFLGFI